MNALGWKCHLPWISLLLLFMAVAEARAGMEVSLDQEYQRLNQLDEQIKRLPAYRRSEELEARIAALKLKLGQISGRSSSLELFNLKDQISELERQLQGAQKAIADFREATSGPGSRYFPEVRNRLATFTLDDPHATGLGDAVSFILSKKLLFSTRVTSYAIVNYRQGAEPVSPGDLAYFDRVDAITKDQRFRMALWGRVSRNDLGARIDTFLQIPNDSDEPDYVQTVRLPEAMGGGLLTARLKSTRIPLQSLQVNAEEMSSLRSAAETISTLRSAPKEAASVVGQIGVGAGSKLHTLVDSDNDWVKLRLSGGAMGWTSVDRFCSGACAPLLDVANYVNNVVALSAGLPSRPVPESLTRDADAMLQQLTVLRLLRTDPSRARDLAERGARTAAGSRGVIFANAIAVSRIKEGLTRAGANGLDRQMVEQVANQLVEASIADPRDIDIVENLSVLFAYLGDDSRRRLASEIAADLKSKTR